MNTRCRDDEGACAPCQHCAASTRNEDSWPIRNRQSIVAWRPDQTVGLIRSRRSTDQLDGQLWRVARTLRSTRNESSFDHLVRAQQQRLRDREAERLGRLHVYGHFPFDRYLDRQISRLGATEHVINGGSATHYVSQVWSV
jgi:hypothetical protein